MAKKKDDLSWVPLDVKNGTDNFLKESKFWFYVKCLLIPALTVLVGWLVRLDTRIDSLFELLVSWGQ